MINNDECKDLIEQISNVLLSKKDVYNACENFKWLAQDIISSTINTAFTKVYLINGEPEKTREEITNKYKYNTKWEGESGTCGIITIYVPKDKCTKALLDDFRKYDPKLGALGINDPCRTYPTID